MSVSKFVVVGAVASALLACGGSTSTRSVGSPDPGSDPTTSPPSQGTPPADGTQPGQPAEQASGWVLQHAENFENLPTLDGPWATDPVPDDGPFADAGAFWKSQGVVPPRAFRASVPFGDASWLTAESYTRSPTKPLSALLSVVPDPTGGPNKVLRVASPEHTDATVIRSTEPLPSRYRISLRVGFADFGDGKPGLNGYTGGETAEPWSNDSATSQNGFYWLTILDAMPRPHNNTWIHHHRKVVIDSDNNYPAWMEIFDGNAFVPSGERPVMMFALDGKGVGTERTGKPFMSYSAGAWQPSGAIRAVDSYLPGEWYNVTIERFDTKYTLEISGRFRYGGQTTYRSTIDAAETCIWHYDRDAAESAPAAACVDESSLGNGEPNWPAGGVWPDWMMFGDPHNNYYEGQVYYDDVRLETWHGPTA